MAIYAEKFPEAITHLEKHAAMVREMATSQNSNGWCVHDQRLKMDRQVRGLPWEVFNIEFYKSVCNQNLTTFLKICNTVGVPIREENTVYAQTTMTFLGIELDTIAIDKVLKIKNSLKLE